MSVLTIPIDALTDDILIATCHGRGGVRHQTRQVGHKKQAAGRMHIDSTESWEDAVYDESRGPRSPRHHDNDVQFIDPVGDDVAIRIGAEQQAAVNVKTYLALAKEHKTHGLLGRMMPEREWITVDGVSVTECCAAGCSELISGIDRRSIGYYCPACKPVIRKASMKRAGSEHKIRERDERRATQAAGALVRAANKARRNLNPQTEGACYA